MAYKSTISFTLDTVCPWLEKALSIIRSGPDASAVNFTVVIRPYQLDPTFSVEPVSKPEFYKEKFGDQWPLLEARMAGIGAAEDINFRYGGVMANTLPAHRVLQQVQKQKGPEKAWDVLGQLYRRYFEEEQSPSAPETLEAACLGAGLEEGYVKDLVGGDEGTEEVKKMFVEQRFEGISAVPHIVLEGKRRDLKLVGAREVDEYVKALQTIIKESK
ncbi:hypothetical protein jhhlp_006397 [Lomentospora prolificans]|uniref:DSBA-like thioredoxin domain-containing protein n=1 Tax=Lomentospora prolificans TaxID=41688 RepID=A0A2N3N5S1_9PEZI|nr:hypothetical protein jhhlp_006397 [Lomentospora prolificans]